MAYRGAGESPFKTAFLTTIFQFGYAEILLLVVFVVAGSA